MLIEYVTKLISKKYHVCTKTAKSFAMDLENRNKLGYFLENIDLFNSLDDFVYEFFVKR